MNRTREEQLGTILRAMLREDGLETPLNEFRATEAWYEMMGPALAKKLGEAKIRGGVLYAQVKSAALRQELMMQRTQLAARINQRVGAQVLQQIVFC